MRHCTAPLILGSPAVPQVLRYILRRINLRAGYSPDTPLFGRIHQKLTARTATIPTSFERVRVTSRTIALVLIVTIFLCCGCANNGTWASGEPIYFVPPSGNDRASTFTTGFANGWNAAGGDMRPVSPPSPPPASRTNTTYTGAGNAALYVPDNSPRRWVVAVYDSGRLVNLQDGSLWEIHPFDRSACAVWPVSAAVTVSASSDLSFPVYIHNVPLMQAARARRVP